MPDATMPADIHGNIPEIRITDDGSDFFGASPSSLAKGTRDGGSGWSAMWMPTGNHADFARKEDASLFLDLHQEAARKALDATLGGR